MTKAQADSQFDIAIVGGGMVGATVACALADTGLEIALLDGVKFDSSQVPFNQDQLKFDPKVSAITPASKQWLQQTGAWQGISATRISPYTNMEVWDADGTGSIRFAAKDINEQLLGYIIENSVILDNLYKNLEQLPQIKIFAPARVERIDRLIESNRRGIKITTEDGASYLASMIIGADGPNSKIRQLAGFETREWDYQHKAIVTTVRTERPHHSTALQRFMDSGPLAFLPLLDHPHNTTDQTGTQQHYCSIVWSVVPERSEQLMALTDEEFSRVLGESIEHKLGNIEWVDKRFTFPLRQRHAIDYVQEGIALVGDAAHTIHPLAGQGVNLGFLDAKALSDEICSSLCRRRSLDEFSILRRYQRQRIGHNLGMMWLMEGFKLLFAEQALPLRWLRNAGMSGLDRTSVVKNHLMRQAMGIRGHS